MAPTNHELLVEAESFDDFGGWVLDSQFELEMGSPYLLAHGNGTPVVDATTTIIVSKQGNYNIWVRAKDWVPDHHPGRFNLIINGRVLDTVFGENGENWNWQLGGQVELSPGPVKLALHDLTGFCGRCDALFFCTSNTPPPEAVGETQRSWRRRLRGLPSEPLDAGTFDVIVVGGGVPGIAAALTSARLGERVALVHDRPFLGGNASPEIGLRPRGRTGSLIDEIYERRANGDLIALQLLQGESNATVFTEHTVYAATNHPDGRISSIDARDAISGREIRLSATNFIDCSGKAILGIYAGAETLFGRESRDEYDESLAPLHGDKAHHGNTVFFRTKMTESPVHFPDVLWATDVSKEFSNLSGQLVKYGQENGPGPRVESSAPDPSVRRRMLKSMTHYWEYGQWLDPYTQGEHIRDHLLRAIYGTFSNVKRLEPEKYANLALDWVAFVPAQGEFLRYKGDYVLTENDIRNHKVFPDAVVQNEGAFCLHIPGNKGYDFRLKDWEWDERDGKPYDIPFRCLYSANVDNLMMAGKHISTTHVASSNTKFMGNGGQHAIAVAAAAHLCRKYNAAPRSLCDEHMEEMKDLINKISGTGVLVRSSHL
ncbi:FAD dependent oxidoreductase domain-containing protein [Trichoderma barbatum]